MKTRGRILTALLSAMAAVMLFQTAASAKPYLVTDTQVITFAGTNTPVLACEIQKTFSGNTLQELKVTNKSNVAVTVKLMVTGSWIDKDGVTVASWNDDLPVNDGWTKDGDAYVYSGKLRPGDTTTSLVDSYTPGEREDGARLEMYIAAQVEKAAANLD